MRLRVVISEAEYHGSPSISPLFQLWAGISMILQRYTPYVTFRSATEMLKDRPPKEQK
jgi:hypothetical protein